MIQIYNLMVLQVRNAVQVLRVLRDTGVFSSSWLTAFFAPVKEPVTGSVITFQKLLASPPQDWSTVCVSETVSLLLRISLTPSASN